jgi:phosphocarrier protein
MAAVDADRPIMTARHTRVINPLGLHARAAAKFVQEASRFTCAVRVTVGTRTMDGKSILGLLLLAAARGSDLVISTDGSDETQAADALAALVARGFDVP